MGGNNASVAVDFAVKRDALTSLIFSRFVPRFFHIITRMMRVADGVANSQFLFPQPI